MANTPKDLLNFPDVLPFDVQNGLVDGAGIGVDNVLASGIDSLRGAVSAMSSPLQITVTKNTGTGTTPGIAGASAGSTTVPQAIDAATAAGTAATGTWQVLFGAYFVRAIVIILGFIFVAVGLGLFRVPFIQAPAIRP